LRLQLEILRFCIRGKNPHGCSPEFGSIAG
jgi:hypothetical protein